MTPSELALLLGLNLVLLVAAMVALWGLSTRLTDIGFVDAAWPIGILGLTLLTFLRTEGDPTRKGLILWLCAVWGLRLGWHLFTRWRARGADGRYASTLENQARERGWSRGRTALLLVFLPQAVLAWLTALPVQLGQVAFEPPMGWIGWTGAVIVVIGIAFESIGDSQLAAFRKDPANAGRVLDTGLWRYSRHPNYFGDACVWWGLWLIAAETGWIGVASIVGPIVLTLILLKWSGVGRAEDVLGRCGPGRANYVRRTSAFLPWPPRKDDPA